MEDSESCVVPPRMDSKLATPLVVVWCCEADELAEDWTELGIDRLASEMIETDCKMDVMMLLKGLPPGLCDPDSAAADGEPAVTVTIEGADGDSVTMTIEGLDVDDVTGEAMDEG